MTALHDLIDRAELADLVARHSLWIDERRYDETDRIFTEDVVLTSRRGDAQGIQALVEAARARHDTYVRTLHTKSNLVIDLHGDTATVRAHDTAVYILDDRSEAIAAAIHHYQARRTPTGWRFHHLEVEPVTLTTPLPRSL